jgi:drug/metabolite transporter (DMT)-like permease
MAILLSYLFYFVAASASPLQRRWLAKQKDVGSRGQIVFAFQIALVMALLGLLLPFFKPFYLHGSPAQLIALALAAGISGAGYFIFLYIAQRHVEAGVTTLVANIYTPITIVLASVFLHEALMPLQIAGTVLLLVGMVVVSKKHKVGTFKFDKYFMFVLISGVMIGVYLAAERALQKVTGFTAGSLLSWWAQAAALGIAVLISKGKSAYTGKEIATTGVLRFLQSLSWVILVYMVGNLSFVSAITTFKVVVIFLAAALFLKERDDLPRKIIGSIIAVAGLLLMK